MQIPNIPNNILLLIFLLVLVNFALYLTPTFAPNLNREHILPYQLWFNALAIMISFIPGKKKSG